MSLVVKKFEATVRLEYKYDDSWVSEWEDNGDRELRYTTEEGVADEIHSWLADLGFDVQVTVKEVKED